jgi:RNA polymerase sigma-70 factor (ECF subfamily)
VRGHALRLTQDPHDAEDLAQEVFLRVLRYLPTFDPELGEIEGWLFRITRNCFLDRVKACERVRVEQELEHVITTYTSTTPDTHDVAMGHVLDVDISAALRTLPPDQRATVVLHDIHDLAYKQIAAQLGIASGTVGSRLNRSHAALRVALSDRAPRRDTGA